MSFGHFHFLVEKCFDIVNCPEFTLEVNRYKSCIYLKIETSRPFPKFFIFNQYFWFILS